MQNCNCDRDKKPPGQLCEGGRALPPSLYLGRLSYRMDSLPGRPDPHRSLAVLSLLIKIVIPASSSEEGA